MGMYGYLVRISALQLESLLKAPDQAKGFVLERRFLADPFSAELDIGKNWHIVHVLLTDGGPQEEDSLLDETLSEAELGKWLVCGPWRPLSDVLFSDKELEGTEVGYGPLRYLLPGRVREIALALAALSSEAFWSRFDPERVAGQAYPIDWTCGDRDELVSTFKAVKQFYASAAEAGQAMLQYIL